MKNLFVMAIAIAFSIVIAACNNSNKTNSKETTVADSSVNSLTTVSYACPMHPEVTSNKPGQCPKCGMDLIKKESSVMPDSAAMLLKDRVEHLNKSN